MRLKQFVCALALVFISGYAQTSHAADSSPRRTKITISSTSSTIQEKGKNTEIVFNNPPGSTSVNKVELIPLENEPKGKETATKTQTTTKQLSSVRETPAAEPAAPPPAAAPAEPMAAAPAPAPAAPTPAPATAANEEHPKQTVVIFDNETGKVEFVPPETTPAPAAPKPEVATQEVTPGTEQRASYVKVLQDKDTFISKSGACVNIWDDGTMTPCEKTQMPGPVPSSKQ